MKLTARDLQQLASASGNFVNLPDAGWVQLDQKAVQDAQEAMADLGVDGLSVDASGNRFYKCAAYQPPRRG